MSNEEISRWRILKNRKECMKTEKFENIRHHNWYLSSICVKVAPIHLQSIRWCVPMEELNSIMSRFMSLHKGKGTKKTIFQRKICCKPTWHFIIGQLIRVFFCKLQPNQFSYWPFKAMQFFSLAIRWCPVVTG